MSAAKKAADKFLSHTVSIACASLTEANRARGRGDIATALELEANVAAMWAAYNNGTLRF